MFSKVNNWLARGLIALMDWLDDSKSYDKFGASPDHRLFLANRRRAIATFFGQPKLAEKAAAQWRFIHWKQMEEMLFDDGDRQDYLKAHDNATAAHREMLAFGI